MVRLIFVLLVIGLVPGCVSELEKAKASDLCKDRGGVYILRNKFKWEIPVVCNDGFKISASTLENHIIEDETYYHRHNVIMIKESANEEVK